MMPDNVRKDIKACAIIAGFSQHASDRIVGARVEAYLNDLPAAPEIDWDARMTADNELREPVAQIVDRIALIILFGILSLALIILVAEWLINGVGRD